MNRMPTPRYVMLSYAMHAMCALAPNKTVMGINALCPLRTYSETLTGNEMQNAVTPCLLRLLLSSLSTSAFPAQILISPPNLLAFA
jgi:hypothetical protein